MTDTIKVLGQAAPGAASDTSIYTVPAATSTVVANLVICNTGSSDNIRVRVAVANAAAATKQYLYYQYAVPGNATITLNLALTLAATDQVYVYSVNGTTTAFSLFGVELT